MIAPLIQIVDENDLPISAATKQEAWDKGLWHRIIRIMVTDEKGRMLLQRRAPTKWPAPNCWDDSVAGHVDAGESYLDAALRELEEELGIKATTLKEVGSYSQDESLEGRMLRRFYKIYSLQVLSSIMIKVEESDISEVRWFEPIEARKMAAEYPEEMTVPLRRVLANYYGEEDDE